MNIFKISSVFVSYKSSKKSTSENNYLSTFTPVHPCDKESKGGCEQVCNKDGVNAKCSCEPTEDFTLNKDGQTCDKGNMTLMVAFYYKS